MLLERSAGVVVRENTIADVVGGPGNNGHGGAHGANGGSAFGVALWDFDDAVLGANSVDTLVGVDGFAGQGVTRGPVGEGGAAIGFSMRRGRGLVLTANQVRGLTGGRAGTNPHHAIFCPRCPASGRGGPAIGVELVGSRDVEASSNRVSGLLGGAEPTSGSGVGPVWALHVDEASRAVAVDATNTVEGSSFVFFDGGDVELTDVTVSGHPASNLGGVVVRNAVSARLSDITVSDWVEAQGHPFVAYGDRGTVGDPGLTAFGVRLMAVRSVRLERVRVHDLRGGHGGLGGGGGGPVVGLRLEDCDHVELDDVRVRRLAAGEPDPEGEPGVATGLQLVRTKPVTAVRVLADDVDVAVNFGEGTDLVRLANLTVHDVTDGVVADEASLDLFELRDSIFSRVTGVAVRNHEANGPVELSYCAFDRVETETNGAVEIDEGTILRGERCLDRADEITLAAGSACIDAGTPGAQFCGEEPGGEACRLDLGHLGGTAEGQTAQ